MTFKTPHLKRIISFCFFLLVFSSGFSRTIIDTSKTNRYSNTTSDSFITLSAVTYATYCTSNGNTTYNTGVTLVSFNTINNADQINNDNAYEDFTSISTTLIQGSPYNITVNVDTDGNYRVDAFVWIDWNQDGDFNDPGETYDMGNAINVSDGATSNAPLIITIPPTATLGTTRMRVSAKYNSNPNSCETGFDGEVEDYSLEIVSSTPAPEINILGLGNTIIDGDTTPTTIDDTDFGSIGVPGTIDKTFTIQNSGTAVLNLLGTPIVAISGDVSFTILTQPSASSIINGGTDLTFVVRFTPSANGTVQAVVSIDNNDSNENPYTFTIQGVGVAPLTEGPGGVTADLELWLKSTKGLSYTDGQSINLWLDQGRGANATVNIAGHEPTYRDNPSKNVNFNPVVEFDNSYGTYTLDSDYSYDDTSTQFLEGASGMFTQDIFVVIIPDDTPISNNFGFMDIFCGDENPGTNETDATGIGAGYYTARFSGEILCYAVGTTSSGNGYGVAEIGTGNTYNNVGIINARNNTALTQQELYYNANDIETDQNDLPDFSNVNDSQYWIGRSEGWEASTNARIAEIITFSSRKDDASLTDERNRIQSYLAIKYGITLGVNGTSQDYVDSNGSVIWDQSVNLGYNHDIAGIGRDDDSDLSQKQSKTVNTPNDITMGLSDIASTNNTNPNSFFNDKDFLIWGNDDGSLSAQTSVNLDLSSAVSGLNTTVDYSRIGRIWKVVETGSVETVKISIPQSMLSATVNPPGDYIMLFSNSPTFDTTAETKLLIQNGTDLETTYDFNGTKYISFAYAPERTFTRSIYFDGVQDYLSAGDVTDLTGAFTISAWINKDANDKTIVSKRNTTFTQGYDFKINAAGNPEMTWINAGSKTIVSSTVIPNGVWHHVAVIYDGIVAKIYIDGIEDIAARKNLTPPLATTEGFRIGYGNMANSYFEGNIDEIRVWSLALTEGELHFIMNQEIEENSNLVLGSYFQSIGNTPTKNDIAAMAWANLEAYYPMSTYVYDNAKDYSNNGALAKLNNIRTVDFQTAPLPYRSSSNGSWDSNTVWLNGNQQTIPGFTSIVNSNETVDWNIVETNHNITINNSSLPLVKKNNRTVLSFKVNSNKIVVDGDTSVGTGNGLTVTHFLKLDGIIDLEGESQLIQTEYSDLATNSAGYIERDQQGTQNAFTYNYWSSPVSEINNIANNVSFNVPIILRDGTNPSAPIPLDFDVSNSDPYYADGTLTVPKKIASYWIYKFVNLGNAYANWQPVGSTGTLNVTEGYTMKGTSGASAVSSKQNYVFRGKPNNVPNGATELVHTTFGVPADPLNPYITLTGNPFLSAIDANAFINDNATSTTQTIYFWEHWGGGTHILLEYQGGYSTYTKAGSVPTPTLAASHPDVDPTGSGSVLPGQYIPVGQGFFVTSSATGGDVVFKNSQRTFEVEGGNPNSVFTRTVPIEKIRLGFDSPDHYHRQLMVAFVTEATDGIDRGYDASAFGALANDSFFLQEDQRFVIQAFEFFDEEREIPIVIIIDADEDGMIQKFMIDSLENISADKNIYIKDNVANVYHDLRQSNYEVALPAGEYKTRFSLVFKESQVLAVDDALLPKNTISVYMNNPRSEIVIKNSGASKINKTILYNSLGQTMRIWNHKNLQSEITLPIDELSTGVYIVQIETDNGNISQKIVIE